MPSWDRRSAAAHRKARAAALRAQVVDAVAPSSPWWRERLATQGRTAEQVATPEGVAGLPAVGERDVCPDGDPAGAAALVLQTGEDGYALHAEGPRLRRALARRLTRPGAYAQVVEQDTRPTTFVWAGLSLQWPVASTRGDLDVVARAGARAWSVLGLGRGDVLVTALPARPSATSQALELAALGAGAPALAAGERADDVAEALWLLPATVLAAPADALAVLLDDLVDLGAPLGALRTALLLGWPSEAEREAVRDALERGGLEGVDVLGLHVPDGHRLPWAQCRASAGGPPQLHAHPDLELLQVVAPDSGETTDGAGELVLTQLGLRGSALLRWRTGDAVDGLEEGPCPSCGRTTWRPAGLRRAALVPVLALRGGLTPVDLRGVSGALAGRADVADWRVQVAQDRAGRDQLLVHVVPGPGADEGDVVVGVARDVRAAAGLLPTQVVVHAPGGLPGETGARLLVPA